MWRGIVSLRDAARPHRSAIEISLYQSDTAHADEGTHDYRIIRLDALCRLHEIIKAGHAIIGRVIHVPQPHTTMHIPGYVCGVVITQVYMIYV